MIAKSKLVRDTVIALVIVAVVAGSYWVGAYAQRREEGRDLAYTQAMLAFGHYISYERIESLLMQKCYEAASTDARELKNLQLHLVSMGLRATANDPELVEYIKIRNPKVLAALLAGQVPEPKPYTTTCP